MTWPVRIWHTGTEHCVCIDGVHACSLWPVCAQHVLLCFCRTITINAAVIWARARRALSMCKLFGRFWPRMKWVSGTRLLAKLTLDAMVQVFMPTRVVVFLLSCFFFSSVSDFRGQEACIGSWWWLMRKHVAVARRICGWWRFVDDVWFFTSLVYSRLCMV